MHNEAWNCSVSHPQFGESKQIIKLLIVGVPSSNSLAFIAWHLQGVVHRTCTWTCGQELLKIFLYLCDHLA